MLDVTGARPGRSVGVRYSAAAPAEEFQPKDKPKSVWEHRVVRVTCVGGEHKSVCNRSVLPDIPRPRFSLTMADDKKHVYDESKVKTLSSLEHIRLRTGMYIGRIGNGSH